MFHDTNDSSVRLFLVQALNQLPSVQIYFAEAGVRRGEAAYNIGELGPSAKSAVPALLQALKGRDVMVRAPAIEALGKIHSDPDVMIPLFMKYLEDEDLRAEAALALANYGSLAKAAVPKIIPLLHAPDKEAQSAARQALKKIDPEASGNATILTKAPMGTDSSPQKSVKDGKD
jgi:HEAT repeat protein